MQWLHHAKLYAVRAELTTERKKRKDYASQRQFKEKPSVIPDCPGELTTPDYV